MMLEQIRRWRWSLIVAALLVAGLAYAFWPEPVAVDTAEVTRGPMEVGITDDGVTRAEEYYVVSAPVTGYLNRIELEAGDRVSAGQTITRMSGRPTTPLDARTRQEFLGSLAAARASESAAASTLAQARRDLQRAEALAKRGFLPRAQLEDARTAVSTGQAAVMQARAEVARLRASLSGGGHRTAEGVAVRAPASGSVLAVVNESEGVIAEGTPLVKIGDPLRIEAVVDLLSREAVRVKPGDAVAITQWGGPEQLRGTVKRVEPFGELKVSALGIEEQRVNVIIGFDALAIQQAARLGHGYQIDATIVLWQDKNALRVPIGALFRGEAGEWRVFAVDGGRARSRVVSIGRINDEYGQVTKGIGAGEEVILNPESAIGDGTRVRPR